MPISSSIVNSQKAQHETQKYSTKKKLSFYGKKFVKKCNASKFFSNTFVCLFFLVAQLSSLNFDSSVETNFD